ncbi:MAG: hypothetical protein ACFFG0_08345 [Candidatus Thorarchaeota archaeon]
MLAIIKSHARHLSASYCKRIGLKIEMMEDDDEFQDAILTLHHACVHTLSSTPALKIIENHLGKAYITRIQNVPITMPRMQKMPRKEVPKLPPQNSEAEY